MIARIEKDTKKPGRDTAAKLADAFNKTIEYILEGKQPGLLTRSDEETAFLEKYRKASPQRRGAVLVLLGDEEEGVAPKALPPPSKPPRQKS